MGTGPASCHEKFNGKMSLLLQAHHLSSETGPSGRTAVFVEKLALTLLVGYELDSKRQLFYHHIYPRVTSFLSGLVLPTLCLG